MSGAADYRIRVQGHLDADWSERLSGMRIRSATGAVGTTILEGRLPDQAALSGVLATLYELHLPVISVECLDFQNRENHGEPES